MRDQPTLGPPRDLAGFPACDPPAVIVRVCRSELGTWYFSSDGAGRFDLRPSEGTRYLASDSHAAIREASRLGPVSNEWVEARDLRVLVPPPGRLANTADAAAGRFGITLELVTLTPYTVPQQWAAAFRAAGFRRRQSRRRRAMYGLIGSIEAKPGERDRLIGLMLEGSANMPGV